MRVDKSHGGGIHKQVHVKQCILLVLLATGIINDLPGLTSCHCDNIGLVSLILLGGNYVSYITVQCVQGNPIFSPLPSLYSIGFTCIYIYIYIYIYITLLAVCCVVDSLGWE